MPYTPETVERIRQLRARDTEGLLTIDDMKEAARLIRAGRLTAAQSAAATKARNNNRGPVKSADQLLDELDAM